MDTATLKCLSLFSAAAIVSIIILMVLSWFCWLLSFLYCKRDIKTTDEETPDIEMAEWLQQQPGEDHESNFFQELNTNYDLAQEDRNSLL